MMIRIYGVMLLLLGFAFQTRSQADRQPFIYKGIPNASAGFVMDDGKATKFIIEQNEQYEWNEIK